MKKLLIPFVSILVILGCSNLNRNLYNAENLAADAGTVAVHEFNVYYTNAMTQATTPQQLADLVKQRNQVHDASRKLAASLLTLDTFRLAYASAPNTTNQLAATMALNAVVSQRSNILNLVQLFMNK